MVFGSRGGQWRGKLAVDFYCIRGWWTKVSAKYALRPVTKRPPPKQLLRGIEHDVDSMMSSRAPEG